MNKKIQHITILFATVFLVLLASQSVIEKANAGFFEDLWNKISPDIKTEQEAPKENKVVPYSPTIDYEEAVVSAVDSASKSVVSIIVSKDLPVLERCRYNPFEGFGGEFDDFFGDVGPFYRQCQNGKTQKQEIGGGSGFVISEDGMILTNKHVVRDEKAEYTVLTTDGEKYPAKVLARDPVQDIAIIKIEKTGLFPAKLGDSDNLRLGQTAIAIGNALGEFRNTVSVGAVSGLARSITARGLDVYEQIDNLIQTDAAINQGNSGGPLLNLRGEVIGINTAVATGAQNIGFAIPINQAKRAIDSVKKTGTIKSPYIGVRYKMINSEIKDSQKLPVDYGALIRGSADGPGVVPGSPAEKGGILAEDIILEVNGEKLSGDKTLAGVVQKYSVGDSLTLKIQRGSRVLTIIVNLEERPKE